MNPTVAERSPHLAVPRGMSPRDFTVVLRAADWLSLAAAPAFAFMAAFTGFAGGGAHDMVCMAGSHSSTLSGMGPMYLLMSVFHLSPWWRLLPPLFKSNQ
jgi:hypothetical protein